MAIPIVVLMIAIGLSGLVATVVAFRKMSADQQRAQLHQGHRPSELPTDLGPPLRIGARIGAVTASWPLARLRISPSTLVITAPFCPKIIIRRDEDFVVRTVNTLMTGLSFEGAQLMAAPIRIYGSKNLIPSLVGAGWPGPEWTVPPLA